MHRQLTDSLNESIRRIAGSACSIERLTNVGGGSISRAMIAETRDGKWFVKLNRAGLLDMFDAEADGLNALRQCSALRVPRVAGTGCCAQDAFIVLEHLEMRPLEGAATSRTAGRALAELHQMTGDTFGWRRDNYIGSTPQSNRSHPSWPDFFAHERLLPQLALARTYASSATLVDRGERLADALHALFVDYRPVPSLLHGDLWSGNAAVDADGKLVLFDPAVYFGDREADLAMTELFGGFPLTFHAAYRDAWPLADGYPARRTLYNLYHVLNHFNLFGDGYGRQAERMIDALLAEIG